MNRLRRLRADVRVGVALGLVALAGAGVLRGLEAAGWLAAPRARPSVHPVDLTVEEQPRFAMADRDPSLLVDGGEIDWRTVFHDSFDGPELVEAWVAGEGTWELAAGRLVVRPPEGPAFLTLSPPEVGDDLRTTLWVRPSESRQRGFGAELALLSRLPAAREVSPWLGYEVLLGTTEAAGTRLARGRTTLARAPDHLRPGVWQQVRWQILGRRYALEVDGRPVLSGVHARQPRKGERSWLGVGVSRAAVELDDLRVEVPLHPGAGSRSDPDLQAWRRQQVERAAAEAREQVAAERAAAEARVQQVAASAEVHAAGERAVEVPAGAQDSAGALLPTPRGATPPPTPQQSASGDLQQGPSLDLFLPAEAEGQAPAALEEWRVILEEGFERHELGAAWSAESGGWRIQDGRLRSESREAENLVLWMAADFSKDFRLAYEARSVKPSPDGAPCDLTLLAALPPRRPVDPRGGYLFRFGSYVNTVSGLSFGSHDLVVLGRPRIEPRVWHRVVAERLGRRFRMSVDGRVIVSGVHPAASIDPARRWGGFYTWKSVAEFDNVVLSAPRPTAAGLNEE